LVIILLFFIFIFSVLNALNGANFLLSILPSILSIIAGIIFFLQFDRIGSASELVSVLKEIVGQFARNRIVGEFPDKWMARDDARELCQAIKQLFATVQEETSERNKIVALKEYISRNMQVLEAELKKVHNSSERLAQIMKETAETSENIAAATLDMISSVQFITDKSNQGVTIVDEIRDRANALNQRMTQAESKTDL
jgi:methyl-accepting chemotaxis protein